MKDEYFKKLTIRATQRAKLLLAKPNFQKDIIILRKKWKIPPSGLTNEEENRKWNLQRAINTTDYYSKNWPKEKNQIIKLRTNGKFEEAEVIRQRISLQAPFNVLKDEIWTIIRKFRLSPRWHNCIKHYLLFNNLKNLDEMVGVKVNISYENSIRRISLEIDEYTTLSDLKRVWTWARKMNRNKHASKFQPIKNFDRDRRAYELQQGKKTPEEILDAIEAEFGETLDYNHLNIIINRYKTRLNIN